MFISRRCKCSSKSCRCGQKKDLKELSCNLALISVKSRLDILFLLKDKVHCVCDLMSHTNMSQSLASHHLADLAAAGLIGNKREGKYVDYFLTKKGKNFLKALFIMLGKMEGGDGHEK